MNVLITGAAKGIGRAAALYFAKHGWNVAVHYNTSQNQALALKQQLEALGVRAVLLRADLKNRSQIHNMFEAAFLELGGLDALVNNAGISQQKLFCDILDDDWEDMISLNLTSVFRCTKEVLPFMIRRKAGAIVNVSSVWGVCGASCEVHYSAAKAGVIGLTKALAKEVAPSGIRVNCVAPGVIKTDMLAEFSNHELTALEEEIPLGRLGTPQDIARVIYFLASDQSAYVTGQTITADGGFIG